MMPTSLVAFPRSSTWLVLIICDPGWKSCAHSIPYTNDRLRRKKLLRPHYTSMVWLGMTNQSCLVHLQKGVRWDISKLKGYETCEYVGTQPHSLYGTFTYKTGYFMGVSVDKYTITFFAHLGGSNFTKQNASNLPSSRPPPFSYDVHGCIETLLPGEANQNAKAFKAVVRQFFSKEWSIVNHCGPTKMEID